MSAIAKMGEKLHQEAMGREATRPRRPGPPPADLNDDSASLREAIRKESALAANIRNLEEDAVKALKGPMGWMATIRALAGEELREDLGQARRKNTTNAMEERVEPETLANLERAAGYEGSISEKLRSEGIEDRTINGLLGNLNKICGGDEQAQARLKEEVESYANERIWSREKQQMQDPDSELFAAHQAVKTLAVAPEWVLENVEVWGKTHAHEVQAMTRALDTPEMRSATLSAGDTGPQGDGTRSNGADLHERVKNLFAPGDANLDQGERRKSAMDLFNGTLGEQVEQNMLRMKGDKEALSGNITGRARQCTEWEQKDQRWKQHAHDAEATGEKARAITRTRTEGLLEAVQGAGGGAKQAKKLRAQACNGSSAAALELAAMFSCGKTRDGRTCRKNVDTAKQWLNAVTPPVEHNTREEFDRAVSTGKSEHLMSRADKITGYDSSTQGQFPVASTMGGGIHKHAMESAVDNYVKAAKLGNAYGVDALDEWCRSAQRSGHGAAMCRQENDAALEWVKIHEGRDAAVIGLMGHNHPTLTPACEKVEGATTAKGRLDAIEHLREVRQENGYNRGSWTDNRLSEMSSDAKVQYMASLPQVQRPERKGLQGRGAQAAAAVAGSTRGTGDQVAAKAEQRNAGRPTKTGEVLPPSGFGI